MMAKMCRLVAVFSLLPPTVLPLAPPHPDFEDEFVRQLSQRSLKFLRSRSSKEPPSSREGDSSNNASPSGERCNEYSDCQLFRPNYGRDVELSLQLIQNTGKLRPLVLLMRFTDHRYRKLPSRFEIDELWNAEGLTDDLPMGSIKRYLEKASYGKLEVHASVVDWAETDQKEAFYAAGVSGLKPGLEASIYPLLDRLDQLGYDFSQNDDNGDKIIDNVMVLHSGYAAEIGSHDCYSGSGFESRVWSHAVPGIDSEWRSVEGYRFNQYTISSALRGLCNADVAPTGTITHELMHSWGLQDLYDVSGEWIGRGTGLYSIMSNCYGWSPQDAQPPSLDPFSRMELGWLSPVPITKDGNYSIVASALSPQAYIIQVGFPDGEFLLIENRQQLEYDELMPGSGLLIWHIDTLKEWNDERGYPDQSGWPGNGKHYRVALLQADRRYDLENGENEGDADDFWTNRDELRPGPEENEATDVLLYPNTNSYAKGIVRTGINIHDISESGPTMSFRISGIPGFADPPTPEPSSPPSLMESSRPSAKRSAVPSQVPSTSVNSSAPTAEPTQAKTASPIEPSTPPSIMSQIRSSSQPSSAPSRSPSLQPFTSLPSRIPSDHPTTQSPSQMASMRPTSSRPPSEIPTMNPSGYPSTVASDIPTINHSRHPSTVTYDVPTTNPSGYPSKVTSNVPTSSPSGYPASSSSIPTATPSLDLTLAVKESTASPFPSAFPSLSSFAPSAVEVAELFDTNILAFALAVPSKAPTGDPPLPMEHQSPAPSPGSTNPNTVTPTEFPSTIFSFGSNRGIDSVNRIEGK